MVIWLLVLILMIGFRSRIVTFNTHYLSRDTTAAVKGVFIIIVLLSHQRGYISLGGVLNEIYNWFFVHLGQLMVTMFFFYSGFGCWESFSTKRDYVDSFLCRRVLKTLVHFDIAVALYVLVDFVLKIKYPLKNYLFCWIGWESVGNSNWFVFTILLLYMVTWVGFRFFGDRELICLMIIGGLCILIMVALYAAGKEAWWYNTALCYPLGMIYSRVRNRVEKMIANTYLYWPGLLITCIIFGALYLRGGAILYPLCACVFCLIVVSVTIKFDFGNPVLIWLGNHLFEIYILQRIPMIILSELSVKEPMIFTLLTLILTLVMAEVFQKGIEWFDNSLFRRTNQCINNNLNGESR